MQYRFSVHTHTDLVDGSSPAEEMIKEAVKRNMSAVGFTEHAVQRQDARYGLSDENEKKYIDQVRCLQKEYEGIITIRLGIERDMVSHADRAMYEYVMGSVHYITAPDGAFVTVDGNPNALRSMIREHFAGDGVSMAARYFETLAGYIVSYKPDIIGHFDVVTKYNTDGSLFDVTGAVYRRAAVSAMERCVTACHVLEINTGAMSRGYRSEPYPDQFLLNTWRELGGSITIGTDSHHFSTVDAYYDDALAWAKRAGYTSIKALAPAPDLFFDLEI